MRFRKSINIFKGVKLNFSKSGVSVTVGGKGVSANIGKKGLFLNTSIPGTGLYDRKKIVGFGGDKKAETKAKTESKQSQAEPVIAPTQISLELDAEGNVVVYDQNDKPVTDAAILRKLKAREDFQAACAQLLESRAAQYNADTEAFVNIGSQSVVLKKADPRKNAPMSADAVEDKIEAWLGGLSLPIDFHAAFEYDDEANTLMVDLDLPEIEHLPVRHMEVVSGKLKEKDKTQKALKQEYARCVFGLGMFCASHCFDVTPYMERVVLSAYTQRRDNKTGDLRDEYIYSVVFEREGFERAGYPDEEPEAFILRFKNRMNKNASGDLKPIVPFDAAAL